MRFKPSIFPLLLALLGAGDVAALGLGQMTVHSRLGARFHAEVELLGLPTDGRAISECFRLTQPTDPEAGITALTAGSITIERKSGKLRLLIRSEQSVNDPVLQVSVRAGCGAEVVRDYMLIIDPVEAQSATPLAAAGKAPAQPATERSRPADNGYPDSWQAREGKSARSIARNLFPNQPSAQRRFLKALQTANPEIDFGSGGDAPLAAETPLMIPDTRRYTLATRQAKVDQPISLEAAPPLPNKDMNTLRSARAGAGRMSDRLSISGGAFEDEARPDGLPLRLATELSSRASAGMTESQRSIFRLEYKLLTAIYDQASQNLSLAEQVRQLESSVAELQAAAENSLRPAVPPETQRATTPAVREIASPQPAHRTKDEATDKTSAWLGLAGLLGAIALLVWFLRRHSLKNPRVAPSLTSENPPAAEEVLPWAISQNKPLKVSTDIEPASREMLALGEDTVFDQNPPTVRLPEQETTPGDAVLTEHYELNPVIEIADIMLSFGRIKGATETLLEYIETSPDEALQPWIKLLDIYRQNGMRQDYENLSQKLRLHFNVDPPHWDLTADQPPQPAALGDEETASFETLLPRLPNIGQIPHIRDKISHTWGTPACLSYVNHLLRNNRRGAALRRGFNLSTVGELLFLLVILDKTPQNPKISACSE